MLQLPCFFQNRGRQIIKRLKKAHNAMDYNNVSINKKPKFDLTSEEIKALRKMRIQRLRKLMDNRKYRDLKRDLEVLRARRKKSPSPENHRQRKKLCDAAFRALTNDSITVPPEDESCDEDPVCDSDNANRGCPGQCFRVKSKKCRRQIMEQSNWRHYEIPKCECGNLISGHEHCKGKENRCCTGPCRRNVCLAQRKREELQRQCHGKVTKRQKHPNICCGGCKKCKIIKAIQRKCMKHQGKVVPPRCCPIKGNCPLGSSSSPVKHSKQCLANNVSCPGKCFLNEKCCRQKSSSEKNCCCLYCSKKHPCQKSKTKRKKCQTQKLSRKKSCRKNSYLR